MAPDGLCLAHREQDSLGEAFEDSEVAFVKGEGVRSEDLEQSDDFAFVANGRCGNGSDVQVAADVGVNPGVKLAIVTAQGFGAADTFSGESGVRIYPGARAAGHPCRHWLGTSWVRDPRELLLRQNHEEAIVHARQ